MARCSVGLANIQVFPPSSTLTILVDKDIQVSTSTLVHPILVDTEERVIGGHEADLR